MELRILLFMTTISFATGQVTMAISKRKITVGSLVELVCEQPGQGWSCDWHRDGVPVLTVRKTSQTPCGVDWYIDYPANTEVICQPYTGRFLLRFQKSTIELNGTIWDCKIDSSVASNTVTISLTKEGEKQEQTTTQAVGSEITEELSDLGIQSPSKSYLGAGIAIGVSIVLVVDAIFLTLAFIYKEKLIVKITGKKETSDTEMSRISISSPVATTTRNQVQPQGAQTPTSSNEYESLQRDNADVHNTYEKMHTYQNL
ncbi:uncharacterized protein [Haliotis asinina]|uniref:uncharacterized protein n=1 Tax=Haliotis asinina TaxID=109174 RepID=UPI0035326BBE